MRKFILPAVLSLSLLIGFFSLTRGHEWGAEGWEAVNVYVISGSARVTIVAKRPLTDRARRMRSMPQVGIDR